MGVFPKTVMKPLVTITPFSIESLGNAPYAANTVNINGATSGTWPVANQAVYIPFFVSSLIKVLAMFTFNGTAAAGNIDIGIYDAVGTRIVSMGPTAQSGTTTIQSYAITATELPPGQYYLAMSCSSTTAQFFKMALNTQQQGQALGMAQQASAGTLPATATFASMTNTYIPLFGLTTRSVI